jgi:hypothetical protein
VRICAEVWASGESSRDTFEDRQGEARQKKFGLTPRQPDFISAVVAGYSAEHLKFAENTGKLRLCNIFDKLVVVTLRVLPS